MLHPQLRNIIPRKLHKIRLPSRASSVRSQSGMAMMTPGAIALSYVPKDSRPALFTGLINALQPEDTPSIDFVASAIADGDDDDTRDLLVAFLKRAIEAGKPEVAVSIAAKYPEIGGRLFAQGAAVLSQAKSGIPSADIHDGAVAHYLRFCKSTFSSLPADSAHATILSASLELLAALDQEVRNAARELIFATLASTDAVARHEVVKPLYPEIWERVQILIEPGYEKRVQVLGYSLWLRWLLSTGSKGHDSCIKDPYWDLLLQGLGRGDVEIRKICLNILRLSFATASDHANSEARSQFERYATVFETIVLGRYMNQIQECEGDLDDLVSDNSLVGSRWLYALLASALDNQMQESTRKFIGNWIMRAQLCSGDELAEFLRSDLLPWAVQGSLFVTSLKTVDSGNVTCSHGERLANYLTTAMAQSQVSEDIQSIVWSFVKNKKTFPYAKVWLLKALSDSIRGTIPTGSLSLVVTEGGLQPSVSAEEILRGLPNAASDYVALRLAELGMPVPSGSSGSRREVLEKEATAKCSKVHDADSMNDLWSDLDYLEFPKELLFHVPRAILSDKLVDLALHDSDTANIIREKITTLQRVAETKTYLVSPLNTAVRSAVLRKEQAFDVLDMTDFIIRAVDNPPEPTIDLMLEEATVHLFAKYEDYFGERPSCGIAALLDLISRVRDQHQLQSLINSLLQRWRIQKVPPPTVSPWKTTLQLQTVLLCLENLQPAGARARELVMDLLHILSIEPLPRYRYLLEWMIVRVLQRMNLEASVLEQLASKDHHSNPKYLASLMKIGSIIVCSSTSSEDFATKLATLYVPLAASSKVVIRHEGQWQVPLLMEHARSMVWSMITDNPALAALDDYIRSLERFREPPLERQIGRFDPETHNTMTNLVDGAWFGLDSTEAPLTSREEFVKLYEKNDTPHISSSCLPLGDAIPRHPTAQTIADTTSSTKTTPAPRTIDDVTALQTKGTAYLARTLSDPSASTASRPHNLIVVGSLVDNPYNLGGLSRVSEIFGASALTLQNQNVVGNRDFTSVSVSSHLHFPIVQLSASAVPGFLAERKAEGFKVVGIEQTDRSAMLGSEGARLPENCVLVVGSEREGIPAVVLTECDFLVEIPQKGVTRSLNVQTAVSVVLFEYARQHGGKK